MGRTSALLLSISALCALTACGSDKGGGGPPGGGGTGSEEFGEPEPEPEVPRDPDPGTCRKLCCSSADCGLDETCTAINTTYGTLGYCSGTGGAIPDGSATDTTLPDGCWTLNQPSCNPITNAGCEGGSCDYAESGEGYEPALGCYGGDNTGGPGEACDVASGPWCIGGFTCVRN